MRCQDSEHGTASTGIKFSVVKLWAKKEILCSASLPEGENSAWYFLSAWAMKNGGAQVRRGYVVRWHQCQLDGRGSFWTCSMERRCSRYIEMMIAFQIWETRTWVGSNEYFVNATLQMNTPWAYTWPPYPSLQAISCKSSLVTGRRYPSKASRLISPTKTIGRWRRRCSR